MGGCVKESKFDVQLFSDDGYLCLGTTGRGKGNRELDQLRGKLARSGRRSCKEIGAQLVPVRLRQVIGATIGKTDSCPNENIEYDDPKEIAEIIIKKPTIWEEGKRSLERILGPKRKLKLTVDEFCARRRTTKSLIKLIRNTIATIKILLIVDYYECNEKEKEYFNDRFLTENELYNTQQLLKLPDEKELLAQKLTQAGRKAKDVTQKRLDEEVRTVRGLRSRFLRQAYDFQMNWILQDYQESYLRTINKYSVEWRKKVEELSDKVEKKLQQMEDESLEVDFKSIKMIKEELDRNWEDAILSWKEELLGRLKEVVVDLIHTSNLIRMEQLKSRNLQSAIEKNSRNVGNILTQFEKLVTFACGGKPGESNYFIGYTKLEEYNRYIHEQLMKKMREEEEETTEDSREKMKSDRKVEDESSSESEQNWLSAERAHTEIDQFKDCYDSKLAEGFRTEVLGLKRQLEEMGCQPPPPAVLDKEAFSTLAVLFHDLGDEREARSSALIAAGLTDPLRLIETAYRKKQTQEKSEDLQEDDEDSEENYDLHIQQRLKEVISAFRQHPHLLTTFARNLKSVHSVQLKPVTGLKIKGDIVGNPHPISNIRPITFHVPLNETLLEKEFRNKREQVLHWHESFWFHHNSKFIKERKEYIEKVQKERNNPAPLTADEMSVFYKGFLDKYWTTHIWYNFEWYKKNFNLLGLAFRVQLDRMKRKIFVD